MISNNDIQLLSSVLTFWDHLTEAQKNTFLSHATLSHYAKGAAIHTELGCAGLLIPRTGVLRVYMLSEEGREITLYRIRSGEVCVLSAACVLQTITFDVGIDAAADCDLIRIDSQTLSVLMRENIYVEAFAYKLATERFSDVMWAMQQILFMSFDKRLAVFLLDETAKSSSGLLKITQEEAARYMGSAREVVSRMLKYFSSEGYVKLSRGEILVTDRPGLMRLIR